MRNKAYKMWKQLVNKLGYLKGTYLFIMRAFFRKIYCKKVSDILLKEMNHVVKKYIKMNNIKSNKEYKNNENLDYIWFFWYQGIDEMPNLVKACYKSIIDNLGSSENVYLITKDNISKYVEIPKYIMDKVTEEKITITHFSDILRADLLKKYGGCWIDATCFVTKDIDKSIFKYKFYSQKYIYGNSNFFNEGKWSAYFLISEKNSIVFKYLSDFFYEYWRHNDYMIDYYLIDYALLIAYDNIPQVKELVDQVPYNNQGVMTICENWNKNIEETNFIEVYKDNWLYKLTWKDQIKFNNDGSKTVSEWFYNKYIKNYID